MRSLADASSRWQETLKYSSSLAELQRAVKNNGPDSPCISGCRSVCWKAFLLSQAPHATNWSRALLESRSSYASRRDHFLKYINHPEYLTAGNSDPLADDPNSPWNTYRLDEVLRAEILQDVQRLPDERFYHLPRIQLLITNVLFIYCKLNPDVGGYRQGMHELLAPIVYVIEQDAIDPVDASSDASSDLRMVEMLDASFVEHDSFALFSRVMDSAKVFYETGEPSENAGKAGFSNQPAKYSIIEKSQYIHEICLYKIDPELSIHLKDIEILPQVFLIRWIRLLFSREFPFNQMLILWDTLFSIDPTFKLIDLICTSMLLRIRWDLLEADYTMALQLLLRYPVPEAPHGPHTFIDDAVYLRNHMDTTGGTDLIKKYTTRVPSPTSRPTTPKASTSRLRRKLAGVRSPLSPTSFRPSSGGVEALFQGAAKNVLEQGEKLGINQAVREAMVEIRRNVQEAKSSMKANRDLFSETRPNNNNSGLRVVAALDRRNRRLASMLDGPIATLRGLDGASGLEEGEKAKKESQEALDVVAAKLQLIKVYLEDPTLALPDEDLPSPRAEERTVDSEPLSNAVAAMAINTSMVTDTPKPETGSETAGPTLPEPSDPKPTGTGTDTDPLGVATSSAVQTLQRPQPPIPTRSTLAQSSFSWMLEPDGSTPTSASTAINMPTSMTMFKSDAAMNRQRPSGHASRERTAFLFGDDPSELRQEDIFGLETIRKGRE